MNNFSERINKIKKELHNSADIIFRNFFIEKNEIVLIYSQSLSNSESINNFILKNISTLIKEKIAIDIDNLYQLLYNSSPGNNIKQLSNDNEIYELINCGFSIILIEGTILSLAVETKEKLSRSISEPSVEQTISGSKDSFNEHYLTNIGLIKKRIKSKDLVQEELILGKQTKTKISILYMDNIIEKKLLINIRKKINKIDTDSILDSSYIRNFIDTKNSTFDLTESTERPDLVCMSLLEGKICIVTENSPNVLIIPTFFIDLFHTPEDYYQKSKNVSFTRIIRLIAFFIAILLPAFYLAITTYNHETIPLQLIINFAAQREGVPFPAIVEAISMSLIFEILKESDLRMPKFAGSSISILGAIVLGDAAVSAGIVSPIMVIVIAMSAICSLMFSHVAMNNSIRLWRFIFMIFATFLGLPGIFFSIYLLVIVISSLKSFGKPYLYPLAPLNIKGIKDTFIKFNVKKDVKRNPLLTDKNNTRSNI